MAVSHLLSGGITMETINLLCEQSIRRVEEDLKDSAEYKEQSDKCSSLYEELHETLSKDQKEKLCTLDMENFILGGICKDEGYKEGYKKGFKQGVRLFVDSLRN